MERRSKKTWVQRTDWGGSGQELLEVNGRGLPPAVDLNRLLVIDVEYMCTCVFFQMGCTRKAASRTGDSLKFRAKHDVKISSHVQPSRRKAKGRFDAAKNCNQCIWTVKMNLHCTLSMALLLDRCSIWHDRLHVKLAWLCLLKAGFQFLVPIVAPKFSF